MIKKIDGKVVIQRTVFNNTYSKTSFFVSIRDAKGALIQATDSKGNKMFHDRDGSPMFRRKVVNFYPIKTGSKAKCGFDMYIQIDPDEKIMGDTVIDNEKALKELELTDKDIVAELVKRVKDDGSTWTYFAKDYRHDNVDAFEQAKLVIEREKEIARLKEALEVEKANVKEVEVEKAVVMDEELLKRNQELEKKLASANGKVGSMQTKLNKNADVIENLKKQSKDA